MMDNWDKLDIYNDSAILLDKKIPKKIFSWITILIILTILFIIFSFIPFNVYKPLTAYVDIKENNSYLVLNLNDCDFPINKYDTLYINSKKYNYKIVKLDNKELILNVNLNSDLKIQNNILRVNILKNKTTLFKIIKNKIKKGFDV